MTQITGSTLAAARDEDHVLLAVVRSPVEPAVQRLDVEAGLVEQPEPLGQRRASAAPNVVAAPSERTESESVRELLVPVGALEDPRLALEPAAVRLLDVLAARSEDVEDEASVAARAGSRAARSARSFSSSVSMCSSVRNGQQTSGTRSATGGSRRSPTRRSSRAATPASSPAARATASIPGDESTPITSIPARAIGIAIRPVPTASSTTGPPDASACST